MVGLNLSRLEFFFALFVLYTVLGCLVESLGMIVITVPLLYPVLLKYGIDPVWFGIILVLFIELGQISPPIGINLFVIQSIWDGKLSEVVWARSRSTSSCSSGSLLVSGRTSRCGCRITCRGERTNHATQHHRILTTHTGSLPRPRELTRLYALRARGEAVDEAEIDRTGREAVRAIVHKQRDAGIDVGNNGEQQRDSFFLYLKSRLSGLGGSWERPSRADVDRYPEFKRMWIEQHASKTQVSALGGLPKAIGEVRYLDDRAINDECDNFKAVLDETPGVFVEPFMSAPVARHRRHRGAQRALRHARGLSCRARQGVAGRVRGDRAARLSCCRSTRPISRWSGTSPTRTSRSRPFVDFVEQVVATINQALENIPRDRVRLHVCWGNSESPHDCDVPLEDILPALQQGQCRRLRVAVRQSAPRARISLLREASA